MNAMSVRIVKKLERRDNLLHILIKKCAVKTIESHKSLANSFSPIGLDFDIGK